MNTKIEVNITSNNLSEATKEQMWQVYKRYYHYTRESFMERVEKNNYYSFYTVGDEIVGFTGLRINHSKVYGQSQFLVYFGQTVVHEDYRGQSLIPVTGAKLCMKFWKEILFSKVYFWADALTYKAYLVFAKTVAEMYPSRKHEVPGRVKAIINHIGELHYGSSYCSVTGTVQKEKVLVNDTTMRIPQKYTADQDIQFYLQANPRFSEGHGLLTICPLNGKNIRLLLSRHIRRALGWGRKRPAAKLARSLV